MTRERHFLYLIFDARRPEWRGMAPRPNALMGDIVPRFRGQKSLPIRKGFLQAKSFLLFLCADDKPSSGAARQCAGFSSLLFLRCYS
jgi:hypothetical protein